MRVIHIIHGRCNPNGHNGISRVVYFLNKYEKLNGINSEIWGLVDDAKEYYSYPRDKYVTVECFPRIHIPFGKHEITERLKKEKDTIDLIHFHMIWFYDKNVIADELKELGIPYIITTHGTYSSPVSISGIKKKVAKLLFEERYLKGATEIHTLTREEGVSLLRYGYKGKSFVGYNGIEFEEIPNKPTENIFQSKPYYKRIKLGWVGVFRDDKNLPSLIQAVSMLPKELSQQLEIILVGPDRRGNAEKFLNYAEELGCKECFDWIGPLYNQDKYNAYYGFDGYVMPSYSEGFSMAILDAMACGKPCLLTTGCNMNYFNMGENNKFFIPCEAYPQDIMRGLEEFLESRDEWEKMGENARNHIAKEFNWDVIAKKMINDYVRIIGGKNNVV